MVGHHDKLVVMNIQTATTDDEIAACYPVMRELRAQVTVAEFLSRIRRQELAGYCLLLLTEADAPVAVAGFRISENLSNGRFLYVDDLITLPNFRSKGYGAQLLTWLRQYATLRMRVACDWCWIAYSTETRH